MKAKAIFLIVLLVLVLVVAIWGATAVIKERNFESSRTLSVLLPYNPELSTQYGFVLKAFESVLQEEGVPYEVVSHETLFQTDPAKIVSTRPAVIFADGINETIAMDVRNWIYDYMHEGGSIAVVYDTGVKGLGVLQKKDKEDREEDEASQEEEDREEHDYDDEPDDRQQEFCRKLEQCDLLDWFAFDSYEDCLENAEDVDAEPANCIHENIRCSRMRKCLEPLEDPSGNRYLDTAPFTKLTGVNYITYQKNKRKTYSWGKVQVTDPVKRDYLEWPTGKFDENNFLSGYMFGALEYPAARVEVTDMDPSLELYAVTVLKEGDEQPAVVLRNFENGKVLYANMPLGYLKSQGDDLPLRSLLRVFLFKEVGIPHLMNVPDGIGGFVFNWHIDDKSDWKSIPWMISQGYFKKDLKFSFHITAGDFVETEGDNEGFAACGAGRPYAEMMIPYGTLGSHGGWAHNWYSDRVNSKAFGEKEILEYIEKNSECIKEVTGHKIIEYSAPNGAFPQPMNNRILEDLGFFAYYNTADTGSFPNRTFIQEKDDPQTEEDEGKEPAMISDRMISFPIMPFHRAASFYEIKSEYGYPADEMGQWLMGTLDYVKTNRTIRMIYSHPYDVVDYLDDSYRTVVKQFFDRLEQMHKDGEIKGESMPYFARFLLRMLQSRYAFTVDGETLKIHVENPEGLQEIAISLPKSKYQPPEVDGKELSLIETEDAYLVVINEELNETDLVVFTR